MVTNESGLTPCANIKCGCTIGVMACDGCEMKSAAVIVTANAVNLIRMLISNSLDGTAAPCALAFCPEGRPLALDAMSSIGSLISIKWVEVELLIQINEEPDDFL